MIISQIRFTVNCEKFITFSMNILFTYLSYINEINEVFLVGQKLIELIILLFLFGVIFFCLEINVFTA